MRRDGGRHPTLADHQFDADLAVGGLAHGSAVLMADPDRVLSLFEPPGLIHHPSLQRLQVWNHFLPDRFPQRFVTPRTARQQLLQALRVHTQPGRHRFDRFALPRYQQTFHIVHGGAAPFTAAQCRHQRSHKLRELRDAVLPASGIPFHVQRIQQRAGKCQMYLTE